MGFKDDFTEIMAGFGLGSIQETAKLSESGFSELERMDRIDNVCLYCLARQMN
ncbi:MULTISPECIES: hypothetical protein [Pontibacter]|uniref:hypothetical protein n=1 Tax=Pontibacter TaxID=323449 RepID=UPI0012DF0CBF|nr:MULTISPECIES: hypothetical protein [Pontibacter]